MKLTFLGRGAAFNFNSDNNCAYFIKGETLYLIDCGEKICDKILALGLLDVINKVIVLITHLHSDHIGSLEPFLYYIHFFTDKSIDIYYKDSMNLYDLLVLTGINFPFEVKSDFSAISDVKVECVVQEHIPGSYGFFIYDDECSIFYSGDTKTINSRAVEELKSGVIQEVYHEVTVSTNSMIHTHLSQLESAFPEKYRKNVALMHFADDKTIEAARSSGFTIVEEVKVARK